MLSEESLEILESVDTDQTIENFSLHTYKPFNSSNLSWNDEICIPVQNKNLVCLPHLSYLYISGKVVDGNDYTFDYNGLAHLFTSLSYELNGYVIDHVTNVGATSTLKAYLSSSTIEASYYESIGLKHGDAYNIWYDGTNKEIRIYLPLKYLLGFFEDYNKIIINSTHELVLIRAKDDSNVFYPTKVDLTNIPKIQLTEVSWKLPQLELSDATCIHFLNIIKQNKEIFLPFRTWDMYEFPSIPSSTSLSWNIKTTNTLLKPRYIIITFQTGRKNNYKAMISQYDTVSLESFQLFLNERRYPYELPEIDFEKKQYSLLYENFSNFYSNYYKQPLQTPYFNLTEFATMIPMIVIDCSRQRDNFNIYAPNAVHSGGPLNIRLDLSFRKNVPKDTNINCLIIYDKLFSYKAMDGIVRQIL